MGKIKKKRSTAECMNLIRQELMFRYKFHTGRKIRYYQAVVDPKTNRFVGFVKTNSVLHIKDAVKRHKPVKRYGVFIMKSDVKQHNIRGIGE